jgi:polyhydroxybutyrate depolymerase
MRVFQWVVAAAIVCTSPVSSLDAADVRDGLARRTWNVDGVEREALVHLPGGAPAPAPVVFAFHGHGGSSRNAARTFRVHELWPDAVVVYPQGLNTPGRLSDPEGKRSGWQSAPGNQGDRDLKFFDAILASLRDEHRVDGARVYVTGHSNGGAFTYLLWSERGDHLAAVAPSGAPARSPKAMKPKPVLHVAGRQDSLVKFEWQKRTIDAVLNLNQCETKGTRDGEFLTRYESKLGTPVVTYLHDGGHKFPPGAAPAIAAFFRSQAKGATTVPSTQASPSARGRD